MWGDVTKIQTSIIYILLYNFFCVFVSACVTVGEVWTQVQVDMRILSKNSNDLLNKRKQKADKAATLKKKHTREKSQGDTMEHEEVRNIRHILSNEEETKNLINTKLKLEDLG